MLIIVIFLAFVYTNQTGDNKVNAIVHEMAQQDVDVLGAGVQNSDDKQDKVDTTALGVAKQKIENVEVEAPNSELL